MGTLGLFGPGFDVTPDWVESAMHDTNADDSELLIARSQWQQVREFGEFGEFLHHAIEWENILYFLYPYFWASAARPDPSGPSADSSGVKQLVWHPDPTRRELMRAGAARVVLPIRPGYEAEFAQFMELGILQGQGRAGPAAGPTSRCPAAPRSARRTCGSPTRCRRSRGPTTPAFRQPTRTSARMPDHCPLCCNSGRGRTSSN